MSVSKDLAARLLAWAEANESYQQIKRQLQDAEQRERVARNVLEAREKEITSAGGVGPNVPERFIRVKGKLFRLRWVWVSEDARRIDVDLIETEAADE